MRRSLQIVSLTGLFLMIVPPTVAIAQNAHQPTEKETKQGTESLIDQLSELRAKVARLEAVLERNHQGPSAHQDTPSKQSRMGMSEMKKDGMGMGMGMDGTKTVGGAGMTDKKPAMGSMQGMGGMSGMSDGSGSMSGMNMGDMGMMNSMRTMDRGTGMMGMMKGMGGSKGMAMQSALPGFPGASHLYHIGATGFFLDHADHIQLTTEQQSKLNQIKEKASLEQATANRRIEEAEQQLWELTAADQPDAKAIEAKIREIEKLRGDQRLAFIRAVGDAAQALTHEQHQALTGKHENSGASTPTSHQP